MNAAVDNLCRACDIDHRTTTPYHPQSNAKIERWHRTLKGILSRLMTTSKSSWETELGPALSAYRNTVSTASGYTPFQALYGRQVRMPLTKVVQDPTQGELFSDDRVATLARIWQQARNTLREEREVVLVPGMKRAFQPRWDTRWQVIRVKDPVYWIRHNKTGHEKVLHRSKLRWVLSDIDWSLVPATTIEPPSGHATRDYTARQLVSTMTDQEPQLAERAVSPLPPTADSDDRSPPTTPFPNTEFMETGPEQTADNGCNQSPAPTPTVSDTQHRRYPLRRRIPTPYFGWDWNPYVTKRSRYSSAEWRPYYVWGY